MDKPSTQKTLDLALRHYLSGHLRDAEELYRQILAHHPEHPAAWHYIGLIAHQNGHPDIALDSIRRAVALAPNYPEAHCNLGNLLKDAGQLDDAISAYRRAIFLRPELPEAHNNLGIALKDKGQLDDAIAAYHKALSLRPNYATAHNNLGNALRDKKKLDEAIAAFRRAISLSPNYAEAHNNLGNALKDQGHLDEAIAAYRKAIALSPTYAQAHTNLGVALQAHDQLDDALVALRHAIALKPNFPQGLNNLGIALSQNGQLDEAIANFQKSIALNPNLLEAFINLGNALKQLGQVEKAIEVYRQGVALKPDSPAVHSSLAFTMYYAPGYDSATILEEHRNWDRRHAQPLRSFIRPHSNSRDPSRRLKLGYVSSDLRLHATALCTVPLFSHHDHTAFEIYCYSGAQKHDSVTEILKRYTHVWLDVEKYSDEELSQRIRADGIDILVDASMHTAGNRLLVFARKPAPVQACWIAAPGTTGLETMDYRLTDPYLDPPNQTNTDYSEKSVRLPDSFWCYEPLTEPPPLSPLPATRNGFITFGCLNHPSKLNGGVFSLWSRVLKCIPDSRLILLCPKGTSRNWALRQLDIEPHRVQFVERQSRSEYLHTYDRIDVALDTFPYNGHMTSLDALWMGVPVITLLGHTVVGRAGLSQLTNLGLPDFVAHDEAQFVDIAAALAADLPRLADLRSKLRARMETSPLMDAPRFARSVESAHRQMWRTYCESP